MLPSGTDPALEELLDAEPTSTADLLARVEALEAALAASVADAPALAVDPPPDDALESTGTRPVAGFAGGQFFIQSDDGAFRLSPSVRMQFDGYLYVPFYAEPVAPRSGFLVRRARPELFGALFHDAVQFMVAGDFADIPNGLSATDVFLIFNLHPTLLRLQVGQFDLPFTLENRTSDRYIDFLERSIVVRSLGTSNKEPGIMVFGALDDQLLHYSIGLFSGDGINLGNLDDALDVVGRAFVRPFAASRGLLARAQVGGSLAWGARHNTNHPTLGGATRRGWLELSGGWPLGRTTYSGADGRGTEVGLVPEGDVVHAAAELSLPIGPLFARAEYLFTRQEVNENVLGSGLALRSAGLLEAHGLYVNLGGWLFGSPSILPDPGVQGAPFFDSTAGPPEEDWNLQLAARFEYLTAQYVAGADTGAHNLGASQVAGRYELFTFGGVASLWWTRHVRISLEYIAYLAGGGLNVNLPSFGRTDMHEVGLRVGLSL